MTTLLQQAIAAVEGLSVEDQDAIAIRLLAEIEDERAWDETFRATNDDAWDRMAAKARQAGRDEIQPLDDAFPADEPTP